MTDPTSITEVPGGEHRKAFANYELYSSVVENYGAQSPQHQGMTENEYVHALGDSRVVSALVSNEDGQQFEFPVLSPVDSYSWLNEDFYTEKFKPEHEAGNLLHITCLSDIEPGMQVEARLQQLAAEDGVLVFDFPSSDPEYPERVQHLLDDLGIEASAPELLGTQTYFAGQAKLKEGTYDPDGPVLNFKEAFEKLVTTGAYDPDRFANGSSLRDTISVDEAEEMRSFYDDAYQVLNNHPCNQGLDPDQFLQMVAENDWVTKIVNSEKGRVAALVLLDARLEELDWVNADYYRKHFGNSDGEVIWFPGLARNPKSEGGNNLQPMVNLIAEIAAAANNPMCVVFDCCDINTGFLDVVLNEMINETPQASVDIQPFATQQYLAVRTKLKQ